MNIDVRHNETKLILKRYIRPIRVRFTNNYDGQKEFVYEA